MDAREAEGKGHAEQGAGDQGIMFGFATNETPELLPAPIVFAHKLLIELARRRKRGHVDWLRPDCKSQVAVAYDEDGRPAHIENVVISTQHTEDVDHDTIYSYCVKLIKMCFLRSFWMRGRNISSTPPGNSSWAVPTGIPA